MSNIITRERSRATKISLYIFIITFIYHMTYVIVLSWIIYPVISSLNSGLNLLTSILLFVQSRWKINGTLYAIYICKFTYRNYPAAVNNTMEYVMCVHILYLRRAIMTRLLSNMWTSIGLWILYNTHRPIKPLSDSAITMKIRD